MDFQCFVFVFFGVCFVLCTVKQNQHLNRSHNVPNVIVQQPAEIHVKDPLFLSEKQTLVPGGNIVRNPSPSQPIKLSLNVGKGKINSVHPIHPIHPIHNVHQVHPNPSIFSDLNTANTPSNMETLGVKLNVKTAHLADDVSLSRITR